MWSEAAKPRGEEEMYAPLAEVVRQRDLFECAIDEGGDGEGGCGVLNGGGHLLERAEKMGESYDRLEPIF